MKPLTWEWIDKAEGDWATAARELRARKSPNYDAVCFHAQQCAEKYFKASHVEIGLAPAKIHDLPVLLAGLVTSYPLWAALQHPAVTLTNYAVDTRYPGNRADKIMAKEAVALCRLVRTRFGSSSDCPATPRRTGGSGGRRSKGPPESVPSRAERASEGR